MFGAIPLAAAFTLIWIPLASGPVELFWYFLIIVLVYDVLYVLVVLNYGALFPEMFITRAERAQGASWRQMFAVLGMILGVAIGPVLYGLLGWAGMGIALGVVTVIGFAIALTGTVERRPAVTESMPFFAALRYTFSNRAFIAYVSGSFLLQICVALLQSSVPFFAKYVIGNPDPVIVSVLMGLIFVVAIPLVYVWGVVIRRFGARVSMLATVVVFALGLAPFLVLDGLPLAIAAVVVVGVAVAGMLVLLDILLAEVIDIDAERTGIRREGMYLGVNGFIVRWSVSIQALVLGTVLPLSGYDATLPEQPASVDLGIRLMIAGLPLVFLLLAFGAFWLYPRRSAGDRLEAS
jgi:GPH family glycoside/pentoside/hexuronide:cation symporter